MEKLFSFEEMAPSNVYGKGSKSSGKLALCIKRIEYIKKLTEGNFNKDFDKKFWVNKCVPEMNRKITRLVENDKKEKLIAEEKNKKSLKESVLISEAISGSEE